MSVWPTMTLPISVWTRLYASRNPLARSCIDAADDMLGCLARRSAVDRFSREAQASGCRQPLACASRLATAIALVLVLSLSSHTFFFAFISRLAKSSGSCGLSGATPGVGLWPGRRLARPGLVGTRRQIGSSERRRPRSAAPPALAQRFAHLFPAALQAIQELRHLHGGRPAAQAVPEPAGRRGHRFRFNGDAPRRHVEDQQQARQRTPARTRSAACSARTASRRGTLRRNGRPAPGIGTVVGDRHAAGDVAELVQQGDVALHVGELRRIRDRHAGADAVDRLPPCPCRRGWKRR